ncbi:MAG: lysylphosphatidylglycerol synthase domain-containing protein [Patescibacteria group bacterium]|nr:lysylphosphatidylglycerol synthase domain-containing protein [Patescibacteria group bacterium]
MKYNIQKIIAYIFAVLIFVFIVKIAWGQWNEISNIDFSFNLFYLLLAFVFGFLNLCALAFVWYLLLKRIDSSVKLTQIRVLDIFIKSWLGRYMPGKVWLYLGKIYLGDKVGVNKKTLSFSVFFEGILSVIGHLIMALIFSLILFKNIFPFQYFLFSTVIIIIFILLILNKNILYFFVELFSKIKKININKKDFFDTKEIIVFSLAYALQSFLVGVAVLFLYYAIFNFEQGIFILGSFVVANFIAKISFIFPAGIGAREGAWIVLLINYISLSIASLISVLSRIFLIIIDVLFYIFVLILKYYKAPKQLSAE